jgi:hypothetical protein
MTTTSDETRSPAIEEQGARNVSRRSVLTWIGVGAGTGPCRGNRHWRTGGIEWCVHGRIGYAVWALARLGCAVRRRTGGRRRGAAGLSPRRSLTDMVSAL